MAKDEHDEEGRTDQRSEDADLDLLGRRDDANGNVSGKEQGRTGERRRHHEAIRIVADEGANEMRGNQADKSDDAGDGDARADRRGDAGDDAKAHRHQVEAKR